MVFELEGRRFEIDSTGLVYLAGTNDLVFFKKDQKWRVAMSTEVTRQDWVEILEGAYEQIRNR